MAATRNPPWQRDELILALDLFVRKHPNKLGPNSPEVIELSDVLNALPIHADRPDEARFRNPNGCYMKLCNFLRFDPDYIAKGKKGLKAGNQLEEVVWNEFAGDRERLRKLASAIKGNFTASFATNEASVADVDEDEFPEGRVLYRVHRARERSRELVRAAKRKALERDGKLTCSVCSFDFAAAYGELGDGYIECHHTKPLSELAEETKTCVEDIALVCANCHRMLHRRRPWLGLGELDAVVRAK